MVDAPFIGKGSERMRARLTVESGEASPRVYELKENETVCLGRNRNSSIVLGDSFASREHAEVFMEQGRWKVRDCKATNGTRVNGQRITRPTLLEHGQIIVIGNIRLRFGLDTFKESTDELPAIAPPDYAPDMVGLSSSDGSHTSLHPDELTTLLAFMRESLYEATPHGLVSLALALVQRQTQASMAGYLSLDPEDPQLRVVHPPQASVDVGLSKQLTRVVQREGKSVWLNNSRGGDLDSESLLNFHDAICVPLRAGQDSAAAPLGALHVYKSQRTFTERDMSFCEVLAGYLAGMLHSLRARRALEADVRRLREHTPDDCDLVGQSAALDKLRQQISRIADLPCTVLVNGESGVGKELVAVSLHRKSRRHDGPFVPVNCAALSAGLIDAQLFGHKKGSFTGADSDQPGFFLEADDGTLFLDEIGEMPLEAQAKLLRVLESKTVRPVGGDADKKVDVRIVAATNRDLEREVREGRFKKDLFFRLTTTIKVPALRDHPEDIPALVEHILRRAEVEFRRRVTVSEPGMERLMSYRWPGNVRQLRSVLETAVALCDGHNILHAGDLRLPDDEVAVNEVPGSLNLEELEAWAIRQALARTNGNNTHAARMLGIHRDTLISKLRRYGIERDRERA
jgi:Nif-specific regulatory protein